MSARCPRYEELRPDQLASIVEHSPVALWPLGLLEHHGWHLPIGFDGVKAMRICQRVGARTGGVLLPVMWWGSGGGHAEFRWTHYQEPGAAQSVVSRTVEQLLQFGFRVVVLLAGHYPWQGILDRSLPRLCDQFPHALLLWGTEMSICGDEVTVRGDHAALEETSMGRALLPELVDMPALRGGRDETAWPGDQAPSVEQRHPGVCFEPDSPLFAQMGEDPRQGTPDRSELPLRKLVDRLATKVLDHLQRTAPATDAT